MSRWGVLGAGGIAPSHVISLQRAGAEIVGVADIDAGARARLEERFGVPTFAGIEELLDTAHPDAVTIALPAHLHLPATRLAAERGVAVLSEKPLASSTADADEMIAVCERAGVGLGSILNNRGYAQNRWIRDQVASGRLNVRVAGIRGALAGAASPMSGDAVVFGVAVHYLDLLRWWLGEPEVAGAILGPGYAVASLRFPQAAAELRLSSIGPVSAGVRIDLEAAEGRLTLGRHGIEAIEGELGRPPEFEPEIEGMFFGAGHTVVIADAVSALDAGRPFPVPGAEGRAAVAMCEAVVRAAG